MSTVEIDTGTYIKRFEFWNPATWSIPKLYWDAWSQEQRLHAICRQLEKVIKYADYIGVNVDDIAARLKAIEDGQLDELITAKVEEWFEEHEADITGRITTLEDVLPVGDFDSENTVKAAIDAINANFENYSTTTQMNDAIENAIEPCADYMSYPDHLFGAWPIIRDEYDYDNYVPQGCCIYPQSTKEYAAVWLQNRASNDGYLRIYNLSAKSRIANIAASYGHGSSIDYDDNNEKMYLTGFNENYYVYELDASNPISPSLSRAYNFTDLNLIPVCYYKNGVYLAITDWTSPTREIFAVTLSTMTSEYLCTVPVANEQWPGMLQSYSYDSTRDIIVLGSSNTGSKAIFFKPDGTLIKTMGFEPQYSFIHLFETQEVSTIGNSVYFLTQMSGNESNATYKHVLTIFEGDLSDPSKSAIQGISMLGTWILVNLNAENDAYNDFDNGNNYIGSSTNPVHLKYSGDLQALFDVFPNSAVHITLPTDFTDEAMMICANGNAVTVDGNNHQIAGAFLDNGQFTMRTMGANTTNYDSWLTAQKNNLPCLFVATNSDVIIQNILSGSSYYACSAQCSKIFCRDSATAARVYNAGASFTTYGVLA